MPDRQLRLLVFCFELCCKLLSKDDAFVDLGISVLEKLLSPHACLRRCHISSARSWSPKRCAAFAHFLIDRHSAIVVAVNATPLGVWGRARPSLKETAGG